MAIDTETKRRSVPSHIVATTYPVPDGSVGVQDRPHVCWIYSGIVISQIQFISGNLLIYNFFSGGRKFTFFSGGRKFTFFDEGYAMIAPERVVKLVFDEILVDFDFSDKLNTGETISGPTITITPTGTGHLTNSTPTISGSKVQSLLSAGVTNTLYTITVRVNASNSQKFEGIAQLYVD